METAVFSQNISEAPSRPIPQVTAHTAACCRPDTPPLETTQCDARRWGFLEVILEGGCHLEAKMLCEFHG